MRILTFQTESNIIPTRHVTGLQMQLLYSMYMKETIKFVMPNIPVTGFHLLVCKIPNTDSSPALTKTKKMKI